MITNTSFRAVNLLFKNSKFQALKSMFFTQFNEYFFLLTKMKPPIIFTEIKQIKKSLNIAIVLKILAITFKRKLFWRTATIVID